MSDIRNITQQEFTFQYGEIKSTRIFIPFHLLPAFTFQYGEIKSTYAFLHRVPLPAFTFQYGEIKRSLESNR